MAEASTVLCKASEIPDGTMKEVAVGDQKILVVNHGGKFYASGNKCTHYGANLVNGVRRFPPFCCVDCAISRAKLSSTVFSLFSPLTSLLSARGVRFTPQEGVFEKEAKNQRETSFSLRAFLRSPSLFFLFLSEGST